MLAAPCALLVEAARLDVGRGVALLDEVATLRPLGRPCSIDARAALLAREEGRAAPELVAFAFELDGRPSRLGGPRGVASLEVEGGARRVRLRAVLRGERFVPVPLSLEPPLDALDVRYRVQASTPWSKFSTAATARWVDRGVPALVNADLASDHQPLTLDVRPRAAAVATMVVDAGAPIASERGDSGELARGGAATLSVLWDDLPIAVATAPDAASTVARVRGVAEAALVASRSRDPMLEAVGQRLASAVARGFRGCRREPGSVPPAWPTPPPELVATGLLDDDEVGCPRIDHLLGDRAAEVALEREGRAALAVALLADPRALPVLGPLFGRTVERASSDVSLRASRRRGRRLLVALLLVAVSALAAALLLRRLPRETF